MKRTTYILIGLFFAGILLISGFALAVFILGDGTSEREIALNTGECINKELPACRVVMFEDRTAYSADKYGDYAYMMLRGNFGMEVQASDKCFLTYPAGVSSYLSTEVKGDTLKIWLDLPIEKIKERSGENSLPILVLESWKLNLTKETKYIVNDILSHQPMAVCGFVTDSLMIDAANVRVTMDSCHVDVLDVRKARDLNLNSGCVRDLYLDVDEVGDWRVNAGAFDIGTMYLTGHEGWIELAQGECERMRWIPKDDGARLQVTLNEPAWVTVER